MAAYNREPIVLVDNLGVYREFWKMEDAPAAEWLSTNQAKVRVLLSDTCYINYNEIVEIYQDIEFLTDKLAKCHLKNKKRDVYFEISINVVTVALEVDKILKARENLDIQPEIHELTKAELEAALEKRASI